MRTRRAGKRNVNAYASYWLLAFRSHSLVGGFVISLPASLIGGAKLFLLLVHHVAAFIHPFIRLAAHFIRAAPDKIAAFFRARTYCIPCLAAGTRRIHNSGQRSQAQTRQEPHKTAATISIRHSKPPRTTFNRMVAPELCKYNYGNTVGSRRELAFANESKPPRRSLANQARRNRGYSRS